MRVVGILILFTVIALALFVVDRTTQREDNNKIVREPAVAGSWYPSSKAALTAEVDGYLEAAKPMALEGTVRAMIVPHAGYRYSGAVAAAGFRQLKDDYGTVILMGPSHHVNIRGVSIANVSHYRTPLGDVPLSDKAEILRRSDKVRYSEEAHRNEHSLELELPFLQRRLGEFEIVPMLVGLIGSDTVVGLLEPILDQETLIVVSADLSHFSTYAEAIQTDRATIDTIVALDSKGVLYNEIDARWAVSALLEIAEKKAWTPHFVKYLNSGDMGSSKDSVVGYGAVVFTSDDRLQGDERAILLELARDALESRVRHNREMKVDTSGLPNAVLEDRGCFVTLYNRKSIRGCIGDVPPKSELYNCVTDNTIRAATHDGRFEHVSEDELEDITIEISVLTEPELTGLSGEALLDFLVPNKHGVVLSSKWQDATFLPQVWELMPGKVEFLSNLCQKSGMELDCWMYPETEVYVYHAEVFSE